MSLLPLGGEAAPSGTTQSSKHTAPSRFTTAAQPSGSKLPRHKINSRRWRYLHASAIASASRSRRVASMPATLARPVPTI
ncbi:hypothetical protein DZG01_03145 [Pseudomonas fluorescens]|nr:hypothetical protein DZG01_03145 [Pseudomonas fluorescens]